MSGRAVSTVIDKPFPHTANTLTVPTGRQTKKGSEIERTSEGNISNYKKKEIGKVLSYFPEKKAAKLLLTAGKLKIDDEIYIVGMHTETFLRQKVKSIQIKQKQNLTETPIVSEQKSITVGVLVDKPVKKNDRVYKLEPLNPE